MLSKQQQVILETLYGIVENAQSGMVLLESLIPLVETYWEGIRRDHLRTCLHCQKTYAVSRSNAAQEGFCPQCNTPQRQKELQRVQSQNRRARNESRIGNLTYQQWIQTLKDFDGKCAYCRKRGYEVIEHFIPLKRGGNTSIDNCIPACYKCNWAKKSRDPRKSSYIKISRQDLIRVQLYLQGRH